MAVDFTDLFTKIGKALYLADVTVTATVTTIPTEAEDYTDTYATEPVDVFAAAGNIAAAQEAFKEAGGALLSEIQTSVSDLIVAAVKADVSTPINSPDDAIDELITQFEDNSKDLDKSAVSSAFAIVSATGNGVIVPSTKSIKGETLEFILAEVVTAKITAVATNGEATFALTSEAAIDPLDVDWPGGSEITLNLTSYVGASSANLIPNGDFSDIDDVDTNIPEDWIPTVATMGTTLKCSATEVQTITIAGTPTTGTYRILWVDSGSDQWSTEPLAYNASESDLQAALREIPGLEAVTVSTSGTTPNFTHTVTMTDVTNPAQFTATNDFDTGTITPATTTGASASSIRGVHVLEFDSNGSQLTAVVVPVALEPSKVYDVSLLMSTDSAPAAGVFTVELLEGVAGTVIADDAGTNNSFTIDATALTTNMTNKTGTFITPKNMPANAYLGIRISTAVSNTSSVYIDEAIMVPSTQLYPSGLYASAFTGRTRWKVGDKCTLTQTNDRGGEIHEWLDRFFDLSGREIRFPTNTAPATQPDTLIS